VIVPTGGAASEPRLDRPAGSEVGPACVCGRATRRLMLILRAPGCSYALRSGGCTNCGFLHLSTRGAPVPTEALVEQLRFALAEHAAEMTDVEELDLYCSGSFFCEAEIPADAQRALLEEAAAIPSLRLVLVESRPEHVDDAALGRARAALASTRRQPPALEVAIGLESADDEIREQRIRKGFSLHAFERAAERLALAEAGLVVYLLLKPRGTGEEEAVDDVLRSGRYLRALGDRLHLPVRVALEPTFVSEGTVLFDELQAGLYRPPSLWSVVRAAAGLGELLAVHVGLSSEGLPAQMVPGGCDACTPRLRAALARFNETQEVASLLSLAPCACQATP
jgi:archaeosine synthase beta-subunit